MTRMLQKRDSSILRERSSWEQSSIASIVDGKRNGCISNFMKGATEENVAPRRKPLRMKKNQELIKLSLNAESWRFVAYLFFWSMVILAITLTKTIAVGRLKAGPEVEGDQCGPFNQDTPGKGLGFDFETESHLMQTFGFANICANWDYTPSREIVAMSYPLFEYSLLIYLVLDFLTIALSYKRGELSKWFWNFVKICFPIEIVLCSWFRMIFVVVAYENVAGHTAGFLGLQISLILLTIKNSLYILATQVSYNFIGGLRNTRIMAITYLISNLAISFAKVTATVHVVTYGEGASWTLRPVGSVVAGQVVDWIWMIFNAFLPLIISFLRARSEYALDVSIDMKEQNYLEMDFY